MRTRGRGPEKKPHHHEWDIGWSSAKVNHLHLFFALVDLQDFQGLPDVFLVPSAVIFEYFKEGPENWPRARYHPLLEDVEKYRNNWDLLRKALADRLQPLTGK